MKKFDGKIVLITGGARGMGRAHAEEFLKEGAQVIITDIMEKTGRQTEKELGKNCYFFKQDVSSKDDWADLAKFIEDKFKRLDVLINNAGIALLKMLGDMTLEEYMRVININQTSIFLGHSFMMELLKKGKNPSVVNIGSMAGLRYSMAGSAYNSSKSALNALTQVAAMELAPYGIRVNAILPGMIETPMVIQEDTKDIVKQLTQAIPLKRIGQPKEITNAVMFFASEDSSYCTGSLLIADGGSSLV